MSAIPKFNEMNEIERLKILALRTYPDLKRTGLCSWHRDDGNYDCQMCYPSYPALLDAHMAVSNKLYDDILKLSGLKDPENGRVGTNAIIAELKRKLKVENELEFV
jgi:hypothetical protein